MFNGRVQPAGLKGAKYDAEYLASMAKHFGLATNRLTRVLFYLEECEKPEIALVQNTDINAEIHAACFVSSAWSVSYKGQPFSRKHIHRDFYYQCLFTAMQLLAEVGCTLIGVENLTTGYKWDRDAYICLIEAWRNVQKYVNSDVKIQLQDVSYDRSTAETIYSTLSSLTLNDHRPIAMHPYVMEGLNMSRIFLPTEYGPISSYQR